VLTGPPQILTLRGRYDHAQVAGAVCFIVDGAEYHSSCWLSDEETAPLVVRRFLLEHGGEYLLQMRADKVASNVITVELN
jgi:hypothetical protein